MKHLSDAELYSRIIARMRAAEKEGEEKNILDSLSNGRNSYMRLDRLESSSYDPSWIDEIEGVLFDLGDIINVPRLSTKTIGDISPIELAKKVTGESVQHLASHTQYIKEVDDYGNVIPSKIMSFSNEDDYLTYENRFIATFIRKLILFVEKRYEYVSKFAQLHDEEVLYLKNRSIVHGADVSIETKIKVISDSETQSAKENNAYFLRISEVRRYLHYYYASPFMKLFKTEKNVRNPILQTNIIRKNVKYHHCYEVYRYIERFENLGVSYKVDETYSQFTPEELRELNYSLLASYLALRGKDKSEHTKVASKVYKPKILTSMDDESFLYNDYLKGPVQFVRTDEGYREFLGHLEPKDLPEEPTPAEKEYYKEEYEAKEDLRRFDEELAALLARKQEEGAAFEEKANAILAKREQERLRLLELERKVVEREQQEMLNRIRAEIILNAREYGDEYVPMPLPEESAKRMEEAMHPTYDGESILRDSKRDYPYRDDNLRPATEQSMEDLEEAYMKELEDILDFEARERKRLEEEKKAQEEAEKAALEQFEATAGEESKEEAEAQEEAQEGEEAAAGEETQEESAPEEGQEEPALGENQEEPAPAESQEESKEDAPAETEAGIVLGVDSSHPEDQKQPKEQEEPASSKEEHSAEEPAKKKKQKKPFVLRERPHVKLRRKPEYAIPAPAEEKKNESEDDEVITSSDAPLDSDLEIRDIPDEPVGLADIEQRQEEYPEYVPPENAAEMPIIPDAFEAEDHLDIPMEEEGENEPQEEEVAQEENPVVEAPAAEKPIEDEATPAAEIPEVEEQEEALEEEPAAEEPAEDIPEEEEAEAEAIPEVAEEEPVEEELSEEEATPVSDFPEVEEEPAAEEAQEEAEEPAPQEEPEAVEEEPSVTDAPEEEAADQIEEEPAAEEEPEAVEEVPENEEAADLLMEDATPVSDFPEIEEEPAAEEAQEEAEEPAPEVESEAVEEAPENEEVADLLMEEATLASDFPEVEEEPATEEEPEAMEEEPSEEQTDLPEEPEEEPVIEEEPENEEAPDLPIEEEATPVADLPETQEEPAAEEEPEAVEEAPENEEVADLPMEEEATPVADLPEEEVKEQPAVDMSVPRKKRRKKKKHHKHSDQPREPRVIRGRPKIKLRIKR